MLLLAWKCSKTLPKKGSVSYQHCNTPKQYVIRSHWLLPHFVFLSIDSLISDPSQDTIIIHSQYVSGRGMGYDCFFDPKEFSKFRNNQNCPIPRKQFPDEKPSFVQMDGASKSQCQSYIHATILTISLLL